MLTTQQFTVSINSSIQGTAYRETTLIVNVDKPIRGDAFQRHIETVN